MFKNETHNHPTEIEPFGGAATCLGGAIRDPLSGRSLCLSGHARYGSRRPRARRTADTRAGQAAPAQNYHRPPRRVIPPTATRSAWRRARCRNYYHPGYVAKRMEIGAVIGAVAARQRAPRAARTGRCHDPAGRAHRPRRLRRRDRLLQGAQRAVHLTTCGAEVQKGNPPTERKIQRLFRDRGVSPPDQALQRFRRGRRVRCHRRAGRRPGHRPGRGAEEI